MDALKAAEALRRREAAREAERQDQKRKLKADRARHAQQVKVSLATTPCLMICKQLTGSKSTTCPSTASRTEAHGLGLPMLFRPWFRL